MDLSQIFSLVELGQIVWFPPESVRGGTCGPTSRTACHRSRADHAHRGLAATGAVAGRRAFVRAATTVADRHSRGR